MPENDPLYDEDNGGEERQETEPAPKIDPEQLARLEQELIEKMKRRSDAEALEKQADRELAMTDMPTVRAGGIEQTFLMVAAALMVLSLPFMHYLLASVLTIFTIAVSLVAGLTSPRKTYSVRLNLAISLLGLLFFEFSAIYLHTFEGLSGEFWIYQVLAFIFLFCTYFSMRTYRKRVLEDDFNVD